MRILLTNDDGPPHEHSSPYVKTLIEVLQAPPFNHEVFVVLPSTQRSWIGKAHLLPPSLYPLTGQNHAPSTNEQISDVCTPTYYNPATAKVQDTLPPAGSDYWVLVPGTPATATQLGIFHLQTLFPHSTSAPIDLVLSGPNYGRNTTAAFALSSGTLGGALEGAVCGIRAIALSFAFFTRQEPAELVHEACVHSVKIVERLCDGWKLPVQGSNDSAAAEKGQDSSNVGEGMTPDVFTINVPLVPDVSKNKIVWTWMLDNKWPTGSLYAPTTEQLGDSKTDTTPSFKWSPSFASIWKVVEESPPGNDGLAIRAGNTSITPLRATYESLYGKGAFTGDFKL